jgi:hypothetical protein
MHRSILSFLLLLSLHSARADFWPEFRGPGKDGHAPEAKVPLR